MTEPRRVRTQAERDADGHAWRAGGVIDSTDGDLIPAVLAGCQHSAICPACRPPRRRWWHRLTRRNP